MTQIQLVAALWAVFTLSFANGLYSGVPSVVEIANSKQFKQKVVESQQACVVEFYAPWCGHCQQLKPEYTRAAKKSSHLVPFFAVNCDEEGNKQLCAQQQIQGFPTIKSFRPMAKGKRGKPEVDDYQGERKAKALSEYAMSRIPNAASIVTTRNVDKFLSTSEAIKVVLMAKKGTSGVPPLFKVLSTKYQASAKFGFVPVGQGLNARFEVDDDDLSHLVVLHGSEVVAYDGEMKKEQIDQFLKQQFGSKATTASSAKKSTKSKTASSASTTTTATTSAAPKRRLVEEKIRDPKKIKPHHHLEDEARITSKRQLRKKCKGKDVVCVVLVTDEAHSEEDVETVRPKVSHPAQFFYTTAVVFDSVERGIVVLRDNEITSQFPTIDVSALSDALEENVKDEL